MEEDYIDWETTKLMVDKGFDLTRFNGKWATDFDNKPAGYEPDPEGKIEIFEWSYPLISIWRTLKWMEKKFGIFITVNRGLSGNGFIYTPNIYDGKFNLHKRHISYDSAVEAYMESAKYCIENLI